MGGSWFGRCLHRGAMVGIGATLLFADATFAQLDPGDLVAASRTYGSVLAVKPSGLSFVSGINLSVPPPRPTIGTGPSLATSAHSPIVAMSENRLLMRLSRATSWGMYSIDVATGNRTLLPGTTSATWATAGDMLPVDADNVLATADDFNTGMTGNGKLLRYNLMTGQTTIVSGGAVGNGYVMCRPRAMAKLNDNEVVVLEFGPVTNARPGVILYRIDLTTGNRSVISTINDPVPNRYEVVNGVVSASPVNVPLKGSGPVFNNVHRAIAVINGRLFIAGTCAMPNPAFGMGICEVNLATGDRTQVGGYMFQNGAPGFMPYGAGSTTIMPDGAVALQQSGPHTLIFTGVFGPSRVWEYDIDTRVLSIRADLTPALLPPTDSDVQFSGLWIVPPPCTFERCCDSIDFNNDTSLFDPQDIEAFLSVYSEGGCVPPSAICSDIDFNNDTSLFDPCDISSFLVMYSEGPCTPCGM